MTLRQRQFARIGERKIFDELNVHHVQKVGIKSFWAQETEMTLRQRQFARIGERKIFDELDVHHVQKVGIKRFWAQEADMTLTPLCSLESIRKKFLMNSTYIMSRKWETNVFGLSRAKSL